VLWKGELKQYDVSDPHNPREAGSVRLGGIVGRSPHPAAPELRLAGAPQMVEVSRDGRRVYFTNSLWGQCHRSRWYCAEGQLNAGQGRQNPQLPLFGTKRCVHPPAVGNRE
jgi:56kDa selenium binding protein (SBP56)